jgi:hypothetical protein
MSDMGDSRLLRKLSALRSRSFTRTFFAAPVLKSWRRDSIAMGFADCTIATHIP